MNDQRLGQDMFNFLQWCHKVKGEENVQSYLMANPSEWSDAKWKRLIEEWETDVRHAS